MADSKYVLPAPETVSMSGEAARRLIGCGSGDAALLYLYILQSGGRFSLDDACLHIGRSEAQLNKACEILKNLGLINAGTDEPIKPERRDEIPEYSAEDIARELKEGAAFSDLVNEVQRTLGKLLSTNDMVKLFGIYDYLGLPGEVILQLVVHCMDECQRISGHGRIPTMNYIEKAAFTWEREGIFSLEAAEAYIMRLNERRSAENEFASAIGISGRKLSSSERRYLDLWAQMGFTADAVALAYDRTVMNTGKLSWNYMDSIMKSWHGKNLHTPDEIRSGDRRQDTKAVAQSKNTTSVQGPTSEEMERMRRTLNKLKDEN